MNQQIEKTIDKQVCCPCYQKYSKRLIYNQLKEYMDKFNKKLIVSISESPFNTTYLVSAVAVINELDKIIPIATILTDLSKAYLSFWTYLTNCKQHTKINTSFSDWRGISRGVLQVSVFY